MFKHPNFKKSIVNLSSTISNFLGNKTDIPQLPKLKAELLKNYKNVVFIIFDGFGINPIKVNLSKDNLIRKNIKQKITSVFPSTTTNATTSLMSCKYPMEHGWLGWSLFFEELNRSVDIYVNKDSYTKEDVDPSFVITKMPYKPYYLNTKTDYCINTVFPPFVKVGPSENNFYYQTNKEMFDAIEQVCKKDGKQFVYCYNPEPDHIMHDEGVTSKPAKQMIDELSAFVENLYNNTTDTLIIITADHGQIDVGGYVEIYKQEDLLSLLETKPYLESRAAAFRVKSGKEKEFEKLFNKLYKKDFKLLKTQTIVDKGWFGLSDFDNHRKLLGDYIAVSTTNKMFVFADDRERFKGHHTSVTAEMEVPLVILKK